MKSILVLLSLIYFISCSTESCNGTKDPQSPDVCFSTPADDANNNCCFIQVGIETQAGHGSAKVCDEFSKTLSIDEIRTSLINQYQKENQVLEDLRCKGSYLKAGLLLLTAFLL